MTTFRSSLALAALLLPACERSPAPVKTNDEPAASIPAPNPPIAEKQAEVVAEVPEPILPAPPSHPLAGSTKPTATYQNCMATGQAGQGVTPAMRECLAAELKRQDERLNAAYQSALQRLAPSRRADLRASERAWIVRRDGSCGRRAEPNKGGTIYPIVIAQCLIEATIERSLWLETYSPGKN